jgi:hypothetical protein
LLLADQKIALLKSCRDGGNVHGAGFYCRLLDGVDHGGTVDGWHLLHYCDMVMMREAKRMTLEKKQKQHKTTQQCAKPKPPKRLHGALAEPSQKSVSS